jgi:hypothetical protein
MNDAKDLNEVIDRLARENAELSGWALATGVILTQLLQTICQRELNPQGAATKIRANAQEAVRAFTPMVPGERDELMKAHALDAVEQYEERIRSVLPI